MRRFAIHISAVLLLLPGCSSGQGGSGQAVSEQAPVPQQAEERAFPTGSLTVIDTVFVDDPLFSPATLEALESGEMIVSDRGSHQAIRLSQAGEILARYGNGIGSGPGEHLSIENSGQTPDGTVWTWDGRNRRINLFESGGSFIASASPGRDVQVAAALTSEKFIGVSALNPGPFVAFDRNRGEPRRWGRFTDEPGADALPFIGYPQRMQDGSGFVHPTMFAGRLYAYDFDGSLLWHRSVIDRFEIPGTSMDGMEFDENDPQPQHFTLNVFEDDVHLRVMKAHFKRMYVDTYDARTGDYRFSLSIPWELECGPLFAGADVLYMNCNLNIVRFRIPER